MEHLHLDVETFCDLDLEAVGVHRYVEHPSFRPLCVAWRHGVNHSKQLHPAKSLPPILVALLRSTEVQAHAWNAAFERTVLRRLGIEPARPISCTMQRALAYGLPASLKK